MDRDNATVVATRASGAAVRATVAEGTRIPPTTNDERATSAVTSFGFVGEFTARAPTKAAVSPVRDVF